MTPHTRISYLKSAVRIVGYVTILVSVPAAIVILVASELVGILEEYAI
jgi:hypothetical protein